MLKSQYFALAALFLSGTALGFMDVFHFGKKASSGSREKNILSSQSEPLFGEKNTRRNSNQITPSLANLESLVSQYAEMPAEESLAIAAKVGNSEKREKLVDDFLQNWIYRDPAEVRQ